MTRRDKCVGCMKELKACITLPGLIGKDFDGDAFGIGWTVYRRLGCGLWWTDFIGRHSGGQPRRRYPSKAQAKQ